MANSYRRRRFYKHESRVDSQWDFTRTMGVPSLNVVEPKYLAGVTLNDGRREPPPVHQRRFRLFLYSGDTYTQWLTQVVLRNFLGYEPYLQRNKIVCKKAAGWKPSPLRFAEYKKDV